MAFLQQRARKGPFYILTMNNILWQSSRSFFCKRGLSLSLAPRSTRPASNVAFSKKSVQFEAKQLLKALQRQDVVFYEAPKGAKRTFTLMYVCSAVQLMFWGNLASLAYVTYSKPESDEPDAPNVLAPKGQRMAIAGGLVLLGVGVATAMCLYPWRYVDKLILMKGAEQVKLVTHAKWIKSHQVKTFPIDHLSCQQKVFTGAGAVGTDALGKTTSSHIFLRSKGQRMGFMLDRKGKFMDSKLFDGLWYTPKQKL
ncbi:transmembrane protein 223-domain-containing protein [Gongronella butleri]|nr:transmembrane protein 223-domain-containing protein [Gongronella butleri]